MSDSARLYSRRKQGARRQFKPALHIVLSTLSRKSESRLAPWEDVNSEAM
jgi:hypothetical protein